MGRSCGLFLDLDGTLADSLGVMRRVYGRFLEGFCRPATDSEFASLNGPPLAEVVRTLKETHGLDAAPEELLSTYRRLIADVYDTMEPAAGAAELLETAHRRGWVVGVVTSNDGDVTRRWLARTGLEKWVDVVVAGDDVADGKPAPAPYRLALECGGCLASCSIAVEDSPQGARAAVAAGLRTVAVGTDSGKSLEWPKGVHRIAGLPDLLPLVTDRPTAGSSNANR